MCPGIAPYNRSTDNLACRLENIESVSSTGSGGSRWVLDGDRPDFLKNDFLCVDNDTVEPRVRIGPALARRSDRELEPRPSQREPAMHVNSRRPCIARMECGIHQPHRHAELFWIIGAGPDAGCDGVRQPELLEEPRNERCFVYTASSGNLCFAQPEVWPHVRHRLRVLAQDVLLKSMAGVFPGQDGRR